MLIPKTHGKRFLKTTFVQVCIATIIKAFMIATPAEFQSVQTFSTSGLTIDVKYKNSQGSRPVMNIVLVRKTLSDSCHLMTPGILNCAKNTDPGDPLWLGS